MIEFDVATEPSRVRSSDCLILPVYSNEQLGGAGLKLPATARNHLCAAINKAGDVERLGRTTVLIDVPDVNATRVMLLGLGNPSALHPGQLREAIFQAVCTLADHGVGSAVIGLFGSDLPRIGDYYLGRYLIESLEYRAYRYQNTQGARSPQCSLRSVTILSDRPRHSALKDGLTHGQAIARGIALTRELGNTPGNLCTPTHLAERAQKLSHMHPQLKASVLDESRMEAMGMGGLLSVSKGSREPAKLIVMEYNNGPKSQRPIALVGKGITFDAGGISLKPGRSMDEMKFDMCGAAAVLGLTNIVAELNLPINFIAVIPASENLPDGAASKPGDVVTSMSGRTIEVLNTDAEGRLVLCDALTFIRRFEPETVIDVATLTGSCVAALGDRASGLFSKDDELACELLDAGWRSGDPAWRLPLWDDYQSDLDTPFADVANIGGAKAGATLAACFLSRFANGLTWAHLDIAGPAWKSGTDKGATGRPVSLLTEFLLERASGNTSPDRAAMETIQRSE